MRKAFVFLLLCLALLPVAAENFRILDYSVDISVDKAKSLLVTESITLDFTIPSHGFIRDIEYRFGSVKADISEVNASEPFQMNDDGSEVTLRFGTSDKFIRGVHTYSYRYRYTLPADDYSDYDELYYNIVSANAWRTDMDCVSFSITFPSPLSEDRIWVTSGRYGSQSLLPFSLSADGLTVRGEYSSLPALCAITVRAEMDDGYFYEASRPIPIYIFSIAVSLLSFIAVLLVWYLRGRDEKPVISPEFYPPEEFSPMDAAYILDGSLSDRAVSAMLIYWAEKGCMTIEDGGKDDFSFTRIEFPASGNEVEDYLFSSFFSSEHVDIETLRRTGFYMQASEAGRKEGMRFTGSKALYTPSSEKLRKLVFRLMIIPVIIHALLASLEMPGFFTIFLLVPSFMAYMVSMQLGKHMAAANTVKEKLRSTGPLLFFVAFIFVFILMTLSQTGLMPFGAAVVDTAIFLISLVLSMIAAGHINRMTEYGRKAVEKILGYREFIDKAEKDKIKRLSEENPGTFYKTLPYAMAFGLEEKWTEAFRDISIEPVSWYTGDIMMAATFGRRWHYAYSSRIMPQNNMPRGGAGTFRGSSGHAGGGFSGGGGSSW